MKVRVEKLQQFNKQTSNPLSVSLRNCSLIFPNNLNAVKCNLTELTTRSACFIPGQRCVQDAHVPRSVMLWDQCASYRGLVHLAFSHFWCVRQLSSVLYSAWTYHKHCDSVYKAVSSLPLPSPFPLMFSVRRVLAFFPAAWGLMAGLPGFPSHGSGLHLGAGCQQWKLLGITDTQPPLSNAVVNQGYK